MLYCFTAFYATGIMARKFMLLWVGFLFIQKKTELKYSKTGPKGKRLHLQRKWLL